MLYTKATKLINYINYLDLVGYEQFIPMMKDCSPLLLDLDEDDPGIFVTQSVHKQQAGFSQSSQIHKKDNHIKGQKRYVDHKRFNNAFMLYACTSPFYPFFAALDVNARMQEGEAGKRLWADCIKLGVEARKTVLKNCSLIKPFIPQIVNGKKWEEYDTDEIANNIEFSNSNREKNGIHLMDMVKINILLILINSC